MALPKWLVANGGLLSFVVVLALAGAGVAVYRSHTVHTLPAADTAAVVTASGSVLNFTDYGVEVPLASTVSHAVYAPYYSASSDGAKVYGISTQALESVGDDTGPCTASHGPLGVIRVSTTAPLEYVAATSTAPSGSAPLTPDNKTLFKIGNYYYQYVGPQEYGCAEMGKVAQSDMQASQSAVAQSFTGIKAGTATAIKAQ